MCVCVCGDRDGECESLQKQRKEKETIRNHSVGVMVRFFFKIVDVFVMPLDVHPCL